MMHTIWTHSLSAACTRWKASLAPYCAARAEGLESPSAQIQTWLDAVASSYAAAAQAVLHADGLSLVVAAQGMEAVYRIDVDGETLQVAGDDRLEVWRTSMRQGMEWLQQVLLGPAVMTRCINAGNEVAQPMDETDPQARFSRLWRELRHVYGITVWESLRTMHAEALTLRDSVQARSWPMFTEHEAVERARDVLNSPARWSWRPAREDRAGWAEPAYVDMLRAHEQIRWIEAAALAVTVAHPYDVPRESESEALAAIQTLGFGRALRLAEAAA